MYRPTDRHHRLPRSRGGDNSKSNLVTVNQRQHRAYHTLFKNMIPSEVAQFLTATWIDSKMYLVAIPRKKSRTSVKRVGHKKVVTIVFEIEV